MTILYGLLATETLQCDRRLLAKLQSEIDTPGGDETLVDEPRFALRLRRTGDEGTTTLQGTTRDAVRVAIVGRPLGMVADIGQLDGRRLAEAVRELDGYWLAFAYDEQRQSLELSCDRLGVAWLFWARVPGGVAFSSDFGALARCLPKAPRLNEDACLLLATLTYPLDDATCFDEIRLVSPDSALTFQGGAVSRRRLPTPEYGDRWAGASRAAKFDALDAALAASYAAWSRPGESAAWTVSLSSGNDSRYGLGVLLRHGQRPACATFGLPGSADVRGAVATCRQAQLRHELFNPLQRTAWESWRGARQRLGVVAGYQYGGGWAHDWRRTLARLRGQVVLGYLGDALSGRHLVDRFGGDWLANWQVWSLDERADRSWTGSEVLRPQARERVRGMLRAALLDACNGARFAFTHQQALHLDLLCRQRRIAAAQVNFLSDEVPVAPLFYTRAMIDFWSNLAYDDLRGQALYLDYARARFPTLFTRPRPPSIRARAQGTLLNAVVAAFPGLRRHLAPPEIDTRALVAQQLNRLRGLVRDHADAITGLVDPAALSRWVDRFGSRESVRASALLRFWNLLLLVELGAGGRREEEDLEHPVQKCHSSAA
jgi:hypothetical protein